MLGALKNSDRTAIKNGNEMVSTAKNASELEIFEVSAHVRGGKKK